MAKNTRIRKQEVKARKTWGKLNPVTKVIQSKKRFKRSKDWKKNEDYFNSSIGFWTTD